MRNRNAERGAVNWVLMAIVVVLILLAALPLLARLRQTAETVDVPTAGSETKSEAAGDNLAPNPSFEQGTMGPTGWGQGASVPGVTYSWVSDVARTGNSSLSLVKSENRYFPVASWNGRVSLPEGVRSLNVTVWVKAEQTFKATLDVVWPGGHEWAGYIGAQDSGDPPANHDWHQYGGVVSVPAGTREVSIGLQMYGPGRVWFDDLVVEPAG